MPVRKSNSTKDIRGVSLLEMAIVLVIAGLVLGGVVAGTALIKDAETKKAIKNLTEFRVAYVSFRDKYQEIPGDMLAPGAHWPTLLTQGNNNGFIDNWPVESGLAWQELTLSNMLKADVASATPHYLYNALPNPNAVVYWYNGDYHGAMVRPGNALTLAMAGTFGNSPAALTPLQGRKIDQKLDDGFPESGKIWGFGPMTAGIAEDTCGHAPGVVMEYDIEMESLECRLIYYIE